LQALKSKVKKELPKKVTSGTPPSMVHQASGISGNNQDLFLPTDRVANPETTNQGISRKSHKSLTATMSMKGFYA
jgi:hypothetical protein